MKPGTPVVRFGARCRHGLLAPLAGIILGAAMLAPMPVAVAQDAAQRAEWNAPFAPFRIIGNVHYVGTRGLASYLITGPQGHVLIDGGLPESAPLIATNIKALGFRLKDVRYILINHAHFDHSGGLAELKRLTGAQLVASIGDKADLESGKVAGRPELPDAPPVSVDRVITDGYVLRLGPIALTAHLTPGHTRGATSWTMRTGQGARARTVLFASSLSVAGQKLFRDPHYPRADADFRATFAKLRAMKADVFLSFHDQQFDMQKKRARQQAGVANAFVDPGELARRLTVAQRAFAREEAGQRATR
ncbi:subclass B3 metallo-beta-lactamase [Sphingobium sp. H39-3-25]|uniref:subclass B3 metallo-beta-lactamase n=1 Tax=Sphingobium arseniciresistens TaxID=3030834 RepID=UPI0023B8B130|nr:subclass B3 metallo-beta-lactamase [Sphingobium arseniciresistens]